MENKTYSIAGIIEGISDMRVGQALVEGEKPEKGQCDACHRRVRYLFVTVKGGQVCSSCVKLHTGATQKEIDKAYAVAYYEGVGGTRVSIEERQAKLDELFSSKKSKKVDEKEATL